MSDMEKTASDKLASFSLGVKLALKEMNLPVETVIKAAAAKSELFKDATAENLHERIIDWVDQSLPAPDAGTKA